MKGGQPSSGKPYGPGRERNARQERAGREKQEEMLIIGKGKSSPRKAEYLGRGEA